MTAGSGAPEGEGGGGPAGLAGQLTQYAGYGLTIGLATAAFAWFGAWLDERLHTEPLLVVIGAFLGFGAGFYSMYWRLVLRQQEAEQRADGEDEA
ncbi:MAG: AtpZ/AtpI family protein [Gemmatimonadota bacterium]